MLTSCTSGAGARGGVGAGEGWRYHAFDAHEAYGLLVRVVEQALSDVLVKTLFSIGDVFGFVETDSYARRSGWFL